MSGTLEEAFAQADEQLNNVAEEAGDTAKEEAEEPAVVEAEEPSEDESNDESTEEKSESFSKVNPDELPDELKGVYKSLQADYTRKTQDIAKQRKETEQRVKDLESKLAELEKPSKQQEEPPKTPEEQLKGFIKEEIKSEGEAVKVAEFRERAIKDYEATDDRLKLNSETYDKPTDLFVGQEMDTKLAEHIKSGEPEYTFDYKSALKDVLAEWDTYVQNKQKDFLEKQSKKAKEKTNQSNRQNPKGKSGAGRPKRVSLDEAIALAEQNV